jgi:hypothetical protein
MNRTQRVLAAAAAVAFTLCVPAHAQSLTITAPGYSGYDLFAASPGYVVAGVATDGSRIWYVESDAAFGGNLPTKIWSRTFNGVSAGPATLVHDFQTPLFGSFLSLQSGSLYFGENSLGGIYAINPTTLAVDPLGTVAGNYDAVSFGGALLISHYSGTGNKVARFALEPDGGTGLALSAPDLILDTGTEFSGPLEIASSSLIYGSASTGLYRYFLTEVAAAIGPAQLSLDVAHRFLSNGANSYLGPTSGTFVWRDSFDSNEIQRIEIGTGAVSAIATTNGTLGNLDAVGTTLIAAATQYGATTTSHVFAVVPEPSTCILGLAAVALLPLRRRR